MTIVFDRPLTPAEMQAVSDANTTPMERVAYRAACDVDEAEAAVQRFMRAAAEIKGKSAYRGAGAAIWALSRRWPL